MATEIETLLVSLRLEKGQYERLLQAALRDAQQTGAGIKRSLDFGDIGAGLTGLAGGGGILYFLRDAAQEAYKTESAIRSFDNTVGRLGLSQDAAAGVVRRTADAFGLLDSQVQSSANILLKAGLDLETTEATLSSLASSAGLAGADIASAMESGARGIAFTRSELLDAAGIATNASDGFKTFATEVGKSTEQLTAQEKAIAFAQAVIREARPDVDDFSASFGGFAQSQAEARREAAELQREVGALAQQGLAPLNRALADVLSFVNDLPPDVQASATAFVAAGAGATALAAGVGTLALVLGPLAGPAGLFILAAAGAAAFIAATSQAPTPIRTLETAVDDLKTAHEEYQTAVENASEAETLAAGKRLTNARDTAQVALDESRTRLSQAQAQLSAAEQAGIQNPEGFAAVAPTLAANVQAYERAVAEQEAAIKLIDMRAAERLTNPRIRGGVLPGTPSSAGTGGAGGGTTPLPVTTPERTVADVFVDLEQAGSVSQQFAAALGTPEAKLADLEERAGLLEGALKEAFELGAAENQIDYLVGRLEALTAEADRLNSTLNTPAGARAPQGQPAPQTVVDAQLEGQALRSPDAIASAEAERNDRRVRNAQVEAQNAQEAAVRVEALRARALEAGGTFADRVGTAMGAYVTAFQTAAEKVGELSAKQDAVLAQLEAGGYNPPPDSSALGGRRQNQQDYIVGLLGLPVNQGYTEAPNSSANPLLPGRGGSNMNPAAGPGDFKIPDDDEWSKLFDANRDNILDAGEKFNKRIGDAGLDFASNLANALADGKITGDEAAGIGAGLGGAIGGLAGSFLGPIGTFLGPVLGELLGGAVGGLFGGGEESADSRAAKDMERRGGASQVSIILNFLQNNSFNGGLDQPSNATELDRQGRKGMASLLEQADFSRVKRKAGATT